ncbi:nucleoside triphosphate pyrophosphohydrolase [Bacillus shivajii]|uniref:nucleoside triphosphate pyrophosphohydrolase n=1 Tax=Bacillus shivajii TaxID=1983719 RepID=UPI001CFAE034|nr:nucleoside triphosphate pyrophosphohydrolase [Bacillus shivajii]UCZ54023.1 nucleoside triphosphate pyrophosphohydrolase [Bacillus shivajii]
MPSYHKLVRDRIPEIIEETGKRCEITRLDQNEFEYYAKRKLKEELDELHEAGNEVHAVEELADMLELIYCLSEHYGYSTSELETIRQEKAKRRGSFQEKLFLEKVEEK